MREIYKSSHNSDLIEGKGYAITDGYFFHAGDAEKSVAHYVYMGGAPAGRVDAVMVYESFDEWRKSKANSLRESALSKLSPEEREALGV